ncbi:hypothetical protein SAMN06297251_101222 [Fulvimarina manganoxydans]|uniref:Uncharacterized protein n=1 Tax=Fulvimarina manganoxydans TaxID=937218 RepID=A0A1W1YES8_9HYPH|nr:hypothetical protein [Fulvimarina manganoxydans]SMC34646.1 hypothetical protein SAMN06297251_101222 [Fulvimarina manganoxydans]
MGGTRPEKCVLCGDPCVKTHIVPRAFAHDIRQNEKHLVVGYSNRNGWTHSQSGISEYLLCGAHEKALLFSDTYGVDFARRASALSANFHEAGNLIFVPNPKPDFLGKFALSVIWRHVVSSQGKALGLSLGTHRKPIEDFIFRGMDWPYKLLLLRPSESLRKERIDIISMPSRGRFLGLNSWRFTVPGVAVVALVNNQAFPSKFEEFAASKDPSPIIDLGPLDIEQDPGSRYIFDRIKRQR